MKITIETEPKEIADLIAALQGQQISKVKFRLATPKKISAEGLSAYIAAELINKAQQGDVKSLSMLKELTQDQFEK
ncbi:MAG: hypothetical protein ACLUFX_10440 [Oscillospiraceae bacterium]